MKKLCILILSIFFSSFFVPAYADADFSTIDVSDTWNFEIPQLEKEATPVSDEEFEEAIKKIDSKVNKWKNWAEKRKRPKGESFSENDKTEFLQNETKEKDADPVICIPSDLKIGEGVIPVGHYQVKGEIIEGKPILKLYQAHYLIAKIPATETNDDFGEEEILFAKFLPINDNQIKIIYGSLDFNAYAVLNTENN